MTDRPKLHVVSMSGGKDSTATALVAIELHGRENCRFVFADTGNEHESTYTYALDYLPRVLGIKIDTVRASFDDEFAAKRANLARIAASPASSACLRNRFGCGPLGPPINTGSAAYRSCTRGRGRAGLRRTGLRGRREFL
jgi:3'-phosphoadenosine 5'-phosphosulfate sulfotransferase (PAPS reductase)/FAD synthetase